MKIIRFLSVLWVFCLPGAAIAAGSDWLGVGLVGGHTTHRDSDVSYNALELHSYYRLPWSWTTTFNLEIETRLSGSVGFIHGEGEDTGTISLGPHLLFYSRPDSFFAEFGTRATLFSETEVGRKDFGGVFQFGSFLGFGHPLGKSHDVAIRFQHYSNAGIYKENRGIDLLMLELRHRF